MVQLSTSAFVTAVALSIPVSVLAGPISVVEERETAETAVERGLEGHEALEARVLGHLWNSLKNHVMEGGPRRALTTPLRQNALGNVKDHDAKRTDVAGAGAKANIRKWHEAHQQLVKKQKGIREYNEDLEAREFEELEARVLGHLWNSLKNHVMEGGPRRALTTPLRQNALGNVKDHDAKRTDAAGAGAKANIRKWHEAHQQLVKKQKGIREYNEELDAREGSLEDILEARYDWEIEDLD